MEVNRISAHIRFFKDIGGSWKSLELAAEADVTIMDDWTVCRAELFRASPSVGRIAFDKPFHRGFGGGHFQRYQGVRHSPVLHPLAVQPEHLWPGPGGDALRTARFCINGHVVNSRWE